jgi:hypothetical protein
VTVNGTGARNLLDTTGSTTLTTTSLHGWTNSSTAGLGPDLTMTGGTKANSVTLEGRRIEQGRP